MNNINIYELAMTKFFVLIHFYFNKPNKLYTLFMWDWFFWFK